MHIYDALRDVHAGIGVVALSSFWVVAVMRKGTRLHRRVGDVYLLAILGVLLTATPLAAVAFSQGKPVFGTFLSYLALVTGTAAWLAIRAIRRRESIDRYLATPYRPVAWLNIGAGAGVFLLGAGQGQWLLMGMSAIGLVLGYRMLALHAQGAADRQWWLKRHYTSVIGSSAAMHIAFLNLGMRHLMPGSWPETLAYLWWFGPVLVSAAVVLRLNRRSARFARLGKRPDELPA